MGRDCKSCLHPAFLEGLCIQCNSPKPKVCHRSIPMNYIQKGFELNPGQASKEFRNKARDAILKQHKLFLVVDLDHTMLQSKAYEDITKRELDYLKGTRLNGLHMVDNLEMLTKIRPFAHEFLQEASKLFHMYIYTAGGSEYASSMARLLDPAGNLFQGRIISGCDSTTKKKKNLDIVFGADPSAVLIVDDTASVWPYHRQNLIKMPRYNFFSSELTRKSLIRGGKDEDDTRGPLAVKLCVLQKIHASFFSRTEPYRDVREVRRMLCRRLKERRRKEAEGVSSLFSGKKKMKIYIWDWIESLTCRSYM